MKSSHLLVVTYIYIEINYNMQYCHTYINIYIYTVYIFIPSINITISTEEVIIPVLAYDSHTLVPFPLLVLLVRRKYSMKFLATLTVETSAKYFLLACCLKLESLY